MDPDRLSRFLDPCPTDDLLAAYSVGKLPVQQTQRIADHIDLCGRCEGILEHLDGDDTLVAALRRHSPANPTPDEPAGTSTGAWIGQDSPASFREPARGHRIGSYELLEKVGQGAMGVVYRARQVGLDRLVALKLIRPELLRDLSREQRQERVERFRTEARAAAGLVHDNIVPVYDAGEVDGAPFYSMPFIQGTTLAAVLRHGPLAERRAAAYLESVARGVHHAHEHGVVHRDLKPSNILLDTSDRALVADFGLARRLESDDQLTATGMLMGTPAYLSPEQARGERVGPASDVYSLGATLYEMLTGRPPFRAADPMTTLRQVVDQEPIPPRLLEPAVSRDLETICLKCLRKEPANRYATALALADDLHRFLDHQPIRARPVGLLERAVRKARRRPAAALLVVFSLLGVIGLAGGAVLADRRVRAARANDLVDTLLTAEVDRVPEIVAALEPFARQAEFRFRELLEQESTDSPVRWRVALALLPTDPSQAEYLHRRALSARPDELKVIRPALSGRVRDCRELWSIVEDSEQDEGRRLRAACLLAVFDPDPARWKKSAAGVVAALLSDEPLWVNGWTELLRPVRSDLAEPLRSAFRDVRNPERGHVAASVLAEYHSADPAALVELIQEADPTQFHFLARRLIPCRDAARSLLNAALVTTWPPDVPDEQRERMARRQVNAAAALIRLGPPAEAGWAVLQPSEDPRRRTLLVHRLAPLGVEATVVLDRLRRESTASVRCALVLSLGEYRDVQLSRGVRAALESEMRRRFRDDPDPGVHSAAAWVLARRGVPVPTVKTPPGAGWGLTAEGHTMTEFRRPGEFLMSPPERSDGSPLPEKAYLCRLRPFAVATHKTTWRQFLRFRPTHRGKMPQGTSLDCPVRLVTYEDAARYCNWLSQREGVPASQWCYLETGGEKGRLKAWPGPQGRAGYRLPTEEEWEYACRAGATTGRFFGSSDELLPRYAWFNLNSKERTWPVGLLKPNDNGLFDVHGNVRDWCINSFDRAGKGLQAMRGSAYTYAAKLARTSFRGESTPEYPYPTVGFRVARSLPGARD